MVTIFVTYRWDSKARDRNKNTLRTFSWMKFYYIFALIQYVYCFAIYIPFNHLMVCYWHLHVRCAIPLCLCGCLFFLYFNALLLLSFVVYFSITLMYVILSFYFSIRVICLAWYWWPSCLYALNCLLLAVFSFAVPLHRLLFARSNVISLLAIMW